MPLTPESWTALTAPRSIALVGATDRAGGLSFTGRFLAAKRDIGYGGKIFFVNPTKTSLFGEPCWPNLMSLPETVDAVAFSIPSEKIVGGVKEALEHGARAMVIYTGGFAERGQGGMALHRELQSLCGGTGAAILGPNCLGIHSFTHRTALGAMRVPADFRSGSIAAISQSGASAAILASIAERHGLSFLASTGNEAVTTMEDLISAAIDDPHTRLIVAFVEALRRPSEIFSLGKRAMAAGKPIVVLKVGVTAKGGQVSYGHTGAIAGSGEIYRQAFDQAGIVVADDFDELAQTVELMATVRSAPAGRRLGLLGTSGGELANAADLAVGLGLELPNLSPATQAKVQQIQSFPADVFQQNPIDVGTGFASRVSYHDRMRACIRAVADDEAIDVVALLQGFNRDNPDLSLSLNRSMLAAAAAEAATLPKPIFVMASRSGNVDPATVAPVVDAGLAMLEGSREALRALGHLIWYGRCRDAIIARSGDELGLPEVTLPTPWPGGLVSQVDAFALLQRQGITATPVTPVATAAEAETAADRFGSPVVMKVDTPRLVHKSDAGGVVLGVTTADAAACFAGLHEVLQAHDGGTLPGEGIIVAPQLSGGIEFYVGAKRDATFGPVVACGMGGRLLEILGRTALLVAPFDEQQALAAIERSGAVPFLSGFRGGAVADLAGLARLVMRVGALAMAIGDRLEVLDLNPVIVTRDYPSGCVADVRLILRDG
jgi:acyl-CoA synthetase (NDP forming)